jgi:apolipoprotein N-acyltransferase
MLIWILGAALSLISWTNPSGKPIKVSLVQGNIPQSLKWSPEHIYLSFDRYTALTEPLWSKSDVIIWPEAAIPMSLQNVAEFIDRLDKKALANHSQLILGIPIQSTTSDDYYNAVITLGATKRTYLKRRLVPYGEYVPFQKLSSYILAAMNIPMVNTLVGNYNQRPLLIGDTKINTSICFEITFPELINMHDKTIGMLLTVTNDAWFGDSSAQAQHLQMAKMRAIELGRPVLFVSNDGITAIINPHGEVVKAAPAHVPFVLNGTVQPRIGLTPWMTNGIDPMLVILFCLLFVAKRSTYSTNAAEKTKTMVPIKN